MNRVPRTRVEIALQRCLNSPYLGEDPARRAAVPQEMERADLFLAQARQSFEAADEAAGLKQVWGAVYHAARALVFQAGYHVEQLHCLEVALLAHYPALGEDAIHELRQAQALVGPPAAALARAAQWRSRTGELLRGQTLAAGQTLAGGV